MRGVVAIAAAGLLLMGCGLPGSPQLATTADLINGAAANFAKAKSFEVTGVFSLSGDNYNFDARYTAPDTAHIVMSKNALQAEAIQISGAVYLRGSDFLANEVGSDPAGKSMVKAVGDRWYTVASATPLDVSSLTDSSKVKANFLNTLAVSRKDNVTAGGVQTAELTSADSIINITESSPHRLVLLRTASGKTVEQLTNADITFTQYNKEFATSAPSNVFDFNDHKTWPPLYSAVSVDTSRCGQPDCTVAATVLNKGGTAGTPAPSTVTFTLTNAADNSTIGSCSTTISPDLPNGQSAVQSCTISNSVWASFVGRYMVRAVPANPAYD